MPVDPELAALLEREAASGLPPRSARSVELTRTLYRQSSRTLGGSPADVAVRQPEPWIRVYGNSAESAAVFFHGGRFFSGDFETHDPLCRSLAAQSGCAIAAVDYPLAPEHRWPAAVEAAAEAVLWARRYWSRVGVAGDSAGANLAAVCAALHPSQLVCQLLIYPMLDATCSLPSHREFAAGYGPGSDDMRRGWSEYLPPGADPRTPTISPLHATGLANLPPAFVLTAEYDCLRDEGEAYARNLAAAGTPAVLRRYEGAIHGFLQMEGVSALARRAVAEAAAWLGGRLGPG